MTNNFSFAKQHSLYLDYVEEQRIADKSRPPFGFSRFPVLLRMLTDPSTHDFQCNTSGPNVVIACNSFVLTRWRKIASSADAIGAQSSRTKAGVAGNWQERNPERRSYND